VCSSDLIAILGIILITGILSGAFISFYLTRMQPVDLMQKRMFHGNRKINLRSLLIVFQFIIFIVLLITTIFIYKQTKYSIEANSNLSKRNIVIVQLNNDQIRKKYPVLKQNIKSIPEILNVSGTGFYFPPHDNTMLIQIPNPENKKEMIVMDGVWVDFDIFNLLDIKMIEGRQFQNENDLGKMLVNESFVREFNLKHPIGQLIGFGTIIGVIKDFPLHSMHKKIIPASILIAQQNKMYQLIVEVNTINTTKVVREIRKKYLELCPDGIFEYKLYKDQIKDMYNTEFRHANLLSTFSILSIFISIIGLFGFTGYLIIQRTKEIGIRKANGASTLGIMVLLSGNFTKWILVSFVISCPIAYYAVSIWLNNFAYKTELSWWVFLLSGAVAGAVALITVSWQSYRAANRNPVESLRYE
jgi:putative ABC transport system permease protein